MFYSSVLATAAVADSQRKQLRREELDRALNEAIEDLRALETRQAAVADAKRKQASGGKSDEALDETMEHSWASGMERHLVLKMSEESEEDLRENQDRASIALARSTLPRPMVKEHLPITTSITEKADRAYAVTSGKLLYGTHLENGGYENRNQPNESAEGSREGKFWAKEGKVRTKEEKFCIREEKIQTEERKVRRGEEQVRLGEEEVQTGTKRVRRRNERGRMEDEKLRKPLSRISLTDGSKIRYLYPNEKKALPEAEQLTSRASQRLKVFRTKRALDTRCRTPRVFQYPKTLRRRRAFPEARHLEFTNSHRIVSVPPYLKVLHREQASQRTQQPRLNNNHQTERESQCLKALNKNSAWSKVHDQKDLNKMIGSSDSASMVEMLMKNDDWDKIFAWADRERVKFGKRSDQFPTGVSSRLLEALPPAAMKKACENGIIMRAVQGRSSAEVWGDPSPLCLTTKKRKIIEVSVAKMVFRILNLIREYPCDSSIALESSQWKLIEACIEYKHQLQDKILMLDNHLKQLMHLDDEATLEQIPSPQAPRYWVEDILRKRESQRDFIASVRMRPERDRSTYIHDFVAENIIICYKLLHGLSPPDIHCYNTLLIRFIQFHRLDMATVVLDSLRECNIRPNEITVAATLQYHIFRNDRQGFRSYVNLMEGMGNGLLMAHPLTKITPLNRDKYVVKTSFVKKYMKDPKSPANILERAEQREIIQKAPRNEEVFTALIIGSLKLLGLDAAMKYFVEMTQSGWWSTNIPIMTAFVRYCSIVRNWTFGYAVWQHVINSEANITDQLIYFWMLRLCKVCNKEDAFKSILGHGVHHGILYRGLLNISFNIDVNVLRGFIIKCRTSVTSVSMQVPALDMMRSVRFESRKETVILTGQKLPKVPLGAHSALTYMRGATTPPWKVGWKQVKLPSIPPEAGSKVIHSQKAQREDGWAVWREEVTAPIEDETKHSGSLHPEKSGLHQSKKSGSHQSKKSRPHQPKKYDRVNQRTKQKKLRWSWREKDPLTTNLG